MSRPDVFRPGTGLLLVALLLGGCGIAEATPTPLPTPPPPPTATPTLTPTITLTPLPTVTPEPPTPTPIPPPKVGRWEGDADFTVTQDGEVRDFELSFRVGLTTCTLTLDHVLVMGRDIKYEEQRVLGAETTKSLTLTNILTGTFESPTMISGAYSIASCGDTIFFGPSGGYADSWTATWKQP